MNRKGKKKVLLFTLSPPIPYSTGERIYTVNTVLPIADEYEYHLFCIGGEMEKAAVEKYKEQYEKYFKSVHVEHRAKLPMDKSLPGKMWHALVHIALGLPFMDASYFSFRAVRHARRIARKYKVDVLEINSAHLAYFKKFIRRPALLVCHNIESDLFPFWIPQGLSGWKLRLTERVARISRRNAERVEIQNALGFAAMTYISSSDMERAAPGLPKFHLPLCFDARPPRAEAFDHSPCPLLWMGGFGWYPNCEGMRWFLSSVLPLLADEFHSGRIELDIVGGDVPDDIRAFDSTLGVHVRGFVENLQQVVERSQILIVPLLTGGGVRVKILEALSMGIPVVSTTKGCSGIDVKDGENIVVADSPQEFADAVIRLAGDRERRKRMSVAGLDLIRSNHNLSRSLDLKRKIYGQLGGEGPGYSDGTA